MKTSSKPQWRIGLKLALACILLLPLVSASGIAAQSAGEQIPGPPPEHPMPPDLPMQSNLFDAEQLAIKTKMPFAQLASVLQDQGFVTDEEGKVLVEVVGPVGGKHLPESVIERFGGETLNTWGRLLSAWVPIRRLTALARALPPGYYLERAKVPHPNQNPIRGEGPSVTNSADYRDQGADCSGLTIAVIDGGWDGLTEAIQNGDAPATFTTHNFTSNPFEDPAAGVHGTAVLETVYDHCPGAAYRLYKIGTRTDTGPAVTDAINHDVDVIAHSIGWFNLGWEDDTGDVCTAANNAADNDILFFTSAGNYADSHWQGNFNDADNDGWHDFGPGDETININMPANSRASFYLSWDTSGGTYNHDFYLYDATVTNVLGQSVNGGNNYEEIWHTNNTGAAQTVHLAIRRASGGTTEMEVFMHTWRGAVTWQEHIIARGSTNTPSNCTRPNVISVGAVGWSQFGAAPGTANIIEPYSSQGPSNSGMTLPDIVGPDDTRTLTYLDPVTNPDGRFPGTSCATPNAAGAAAAFWSSVPSLSPEAVGYLVFEQARIYKDWGDGGDDNVYGRGGVWLYTYHDNTVWVDRRYNNMAGLATAPYYYVAHAQNAAVSGGRVVFLGQHYPESITLNKRLLYETIGSTAVLGE